MFEIQNHGSLFLVVPQDEAAEEWLREVTSPEAMWWAGGLVVEPRYIEDLVGGMLVEGWEVR